MLKEREVKAYEAKRQSSRNRSAKRVKRVVLLESHRCKMDGTSTEWTHSARIGLQAYGQRDPLVEYKMVGYDMFGSMTNAITEVQCVF